MNQSPSPAFDRNIRAALAYWQDKLAGETVAAIDRDRHNLHRAVEFGLAVPVTERAAAEVAAAAFPFVFASGYWREWLPLMERAATIHSRLLPKAAFRVLTRLGQLRRLNRKLEEALAAHRQALALARELEEPLLLAEAHYHLGRALRDAYLYEQAEQHLQAAWQIVEQLEGPEVEKVAAVVYNALGRVAHDCGRLEEAARHLERAIALERKHGSLTTLTDALHDLGNVHRARAAFEAALACFDEALSLLAGTGHRLNQAQIQVGIGVLYFTQQDYARAEAAFREIDFSYLRETGQLHLQAIILNSLGNALLYQSRHDEAAKLLEEAAALWRSLDDDLELANTIGSRGEALAGLGRAEEAEALFAEALALLAPFPHSAKAARLRAFFTAEREKVAGQASG